jgi:hypothetical protein
MLLKFGTPCRSRGQILGHLWGLSIEPGERLLLRLIVEEPQSEPLVRVQVPFGRLDQADADSVALGLAAEEFQSLPQFEGPGGRSRRRSGRRRRGEEPAFKTLTTSTRIACRDGQVGTLNGLGVDARTGDIVDVAFAFGVSTTRELAIGIDQVEEISEETIQLRLNMDDLAEHPSRRG